MKKIVLQEDILKIFLALFREVAAGHDTSTDYQESVLKVPYFFPQPFCFAHFYLEPSSFYAFVSCYHNKPSMFPPCFSLFYSIFTFEESSGFPSICSFSIFFLSCTFKYRLEYIATTTCFDMFYSRGGQWMYLREQKLKGQM